MDPEQHSRRRFLTTTAGAALTTVIPGGATAAFAAPLPPKPPGTRIAVIDLVDVLADHYRQWVFGSSSRGALFSKATFISTDRYSYSVRNSQQGRFLHWHVQPAGIHLGLTPDGVSATGAVAARWFLARPTGGRGPVAYGEPVALGLGGEPSFLCHRQRSTGPHLDWSSEPVPEWRILGGSAGTPVSAGERVALFNQTVEDCLTHVTRTAGAEVGWPGTERRPDRPGTLVAEALPTHRWRALVALLAR